MRDQAGGLADTEYMKTDGSTVKKDVNWVMGRKNPNHGLLPVRTVLREAGDPQDALKTVHIAGTNGKGSTVNYLRDILMAAGYTVGTFTSPHLQKHFDRIRINGKWIEEDVFQSYLDRFLPRIEAFGMGMFEIDTVIAFTWFRDMRVDYALIETGLGGRLDNTNVIAAPELEIITTIGRDHMNILGERISQIAFEKAGIIMPYSRCACGRLLPEAMQVIRKKAQRVHAAVSVPQARITGTHSFVYRNCPYTVQGGLYQKDNALLALHSAWLLGIDVSDAKIVQAVYDSFWAGRFEKISQDPLVILDGAHNEEGTAALAESMKILPKPRVCVFSALADKEGRKMVQTLEDACEQMILTHFDNARSSQQVEQLSASAVRIHDWKEAIETGRKMCGQNGTLIITGSLYFVSLVRESLLGK